ncbi:VWA domain-containing protein [Sphaerisporangium album]|uniref:VWA domain-containing protein n=1 Tax=Sphaerisporangium album TaxID=509200 RepID=A0A367FQQ4_9ACTN|nr:VWA domain-containing protein [Sphaerisporangium album]RCG32713.1 VWA domain-containing protein [Sphaerisporangium album]
MHVSAHLDLDVVPLDQDGEVTVLVQITAPRPKPSATRRPATLQIVLDRSGSMAGGRLDGAKRALLSLVDRLDPADDFGLVSFDDTARVDLPAGPLTDKKGAKHAIAALRPGNQTDLSSGLLRGIQEAHRAAGDRGATLLLISDGHANMGTTDPVKLGQVAMAAHRHGVSTTTLGYGLDYDERLMAAIADGGAGSALHAEDPDTAGRLIAGEVDGLLAKVTQALSLAVTPRHPVSSVLLYGGLPSNRLPNGAIMAELGDLYAGETRKTLLRLLVPAISRLGPATIADLVFTYVEAATLTTYTVTVPVSVNVVPGDEAAGRVPDLTVRAERLFQEAQDAKRQASEALLNGDLARAEEVLNSAGDELEKNLSWAPNSDELSAEARQLRRYARDSYQDPNRVSKEALANWHRTTRKRGRPSPEPDAPSSDPSDER